MKLLRKDDWHEDMGDCLFFHFYDMESPPTVIYSNPLSSDFQEKHENYYSHFLKLDMNKIMDDAERDFDMQFHEDVCKYWDSVDVDINSY